MVILQKFLMTYYTAVYTVNHTALGTLSHIVMNTTYEVCHFPHWFRLCSQLHTNILLTLFSVHAVQTMWMLCMGPMTYFSAVYTTEHAALHDLDWFWLCSQLHTNIPITLFVCMLRTLSRYSAWGVDDLLHCSVYYLAHCKAFDFDFQGTVWY